MVQSKEEFIRSYLPDEVEKIELTQINMDITDLGLGDILRNLNALYPYNTRSRNAIMSGKLVVGVLCKTETLYPISGLFVLIGADHLMDKFEMMATNYLVLCLSEKTMRSDDKINNAIYGLTEYLVQNYRDTIKNLPDFYRKFIYFPEDGELDDSQDDDYETDEY